MDHQNIIFDIEHPGNILWGELELTTVASSYYTNKKLGVLDFSQCKYH